jgi:hypothetical protein
MGEHLLGGVDVEREFRVVIPRQDNAQQPISVDVLRGLVREFADHFGGATVIPRAGGCWEMGGLYGLQMHCEPNMIVEAVRSGPEVTQQQLDEDERWVRDFARRVGELLGQEAVFEQQVTGTRTTFQPGHPAERLPPQLLQQGPPPTDRDSFARLLYGL